MSISNYRCEKSMAYAVVKSIIGSGPNGYTKEQYDAILEYLNEAINFSECWEKIWTDSKFRFGVKPSDLALKHTLPLLKDIKGKVLWELGAGTGRDSIFFSKYCRKVASVEIAKAAANTLKEQTDNKGIRNIKVINDDVWSALKRQNNSKNGFVDMIHAHSFLHYTNSVMTDIIFSEMHQLLKKGGHVVFAVKGKGDHLFGKGKEIEEDVWVYPDGQRRRFYDENGIKKVLSKAGFKVKTIKTEKEHFDNKTSEFVIAVAKKV